MDLNPNLDRVVSDPIRGWIKIDKELGARHMFTIGIPDPMPSEALQVYADAANKAELSGNVSYPPVTGIEALRKSIVKLENNFGVDLTEEDADRILITVGGSMGMYFCSNLFRPGTDVIVNLPCWGTIFNIMRGNGLNCIPAQLFEDGKFIEENASAALTENTQAAYINIPSNPVSKILPRTAISDFASWAVSNKLQIISDSPYKYLVYDRKKKYVSPLNLSDDINRATIKVSSFSKIIKPDLRLGFLRLSPDVLENPSAKNIVFYFRNLSAGVSGPIQSGTNALLEYDPRLKFLEPVVEGYEEKAKLIQAHMAGIGCQCDVPDAGYYIFSKTPNEEDGQAFVRRMAKEHRIGFVPGSSFGGDMPGFEHLSKYFRIGFGGGWTKEKISDVFEGLKE